MKVFDIMSEHIVTVGLGEPVAAAARLLKQYNIGAVPVCDERGNLRGMITDRDIAVRCAANGLSPMETKTSDSMPTRRPSRHTGSRRICASAMSRAASPT